MKYVSSQRRAIDESQCAPRPRSVPSSDVRTCLIRSRRSETWATKNRDHIVHLSTFSMLEFTSQLIFSLRPALVDQDKVNETYACDGGTMNAGGTSLRCRWRYLTSLPGSLPHLHTHAISRNAGTFTLPYPYYSSPYCNSNEITTERE